MRAARESGALTRLGRSQAYSLVASVFGNIFPDDYDRVSRHTRQDAEARREASGPALCCICSRCVLLNHACVVV